jgi:hypothetical protein
MKSENLAEHLLMFVSTAEDAVIKVDIINGLSGYEFSRLRLTGSVGSAVLWTNRTAVTQVVQLNDRVIRLAPGRNEGATAITRLSEPGEIVGRLRSNRAASITFTVTGEMSL